MRTELNKIGMKGQIVIGEGELDEAPMLYIGERLGTNNGPELDIAVDPLKEQILPQIIYQSLSYYLLTKKTFNAPETYMDKISVNISELIVDLDYSTKKNIFNLAEYKKKPENLTACILDRLDIKK